MRTTFDTIGVTGDRYVSIKSVVEYISTGIVVVSEAGLSRQIDPAIAVGVCEAMALVVRSLESANQAP